MAESQKSGSLEIQGFVFCVILYGVSFLEVVLIYFLYEKSKLPLFVQKCFFSPKGFQDCPKPWEADLRFGRICPATEWTLPFHPSVAHRLGRSVHQNTLGNCICLDILSCTLLGCWATDMTAQVILVPKSIQTTLQGDGIKAVI